MADIITRLILKSDAFDANLKRAKGSVNSYQNDIFKCGKNSWGGYNEVCRDNWRCGGGL